MKSDGGTLSDRQLADKLHRSRFGPELHRARLSKVKAELVTSEIRNICDASGGRLTYAPGGHDGAGTVSVNQPQPPTQSAIVDALCSIVVECGGRIPGNRLGSLSARLSNHLPSMQSQIDHVWAGLDGLRGICAASAGRLVHTVSTGEGPAGLIVAGTDIRGNVESVSPKGWGVLRLDGGNGGETFFHVNNTLHAAEPIEQWFRRHDRIVCQLMPHPTRGFEAARVRLQLWDGDAWPDTLCSRPNVLRAAQRSGGKVEQVFPLHTDIQATVKEIRAGGFGFLKPTDYRGDIFFHVGATLHTDLLRAFKIGDHVTCRVSTSKKVHPLEPGGCTAFRSRSNTNMLTHPARGRSARRRRWRRSGSSCRTRRGRKATPES